MLQLCCSLKLAHGGKLPVVTCVVVPFSIVREHAYTVLMNYIATRLPVSPVCVSQGGVCCDPPERALRFYVSGANVKSIVRCVCSGKNRICDILIYIRVYTVLIINCASKLH